MTTFGQFGKILSCSLKQHYDGQGTIVSATIEFSSYVSASEWLDPLYATLPSKKPKMKAPSYTGFLHVP
ncbi:hypothetical protein PGT21_013379 [Puccinia graminis f. sp. tritici]|uniref:Uncharacterized protein n=1 Tax=Puccinia graminis f. sp. tritici TaxID=56615 RepID=A0A5B0MWN6_PUCGR|nr:hypothetical protein PGT21_013379 [Puccinia graminis f. sp. tritici]KAA1131542.1 hypothetical protein PGTUg99_029399 [Puccinia graminis f. sp. tritici]